MDRNLETQILERAVALGLIHSQGLMLLERMLNRYGSRLGSLIGTGRLDAEIVRDIQSELQNGETLVVPKDALNEPTVRMRSLGETHFVSDDSTRQSGFWSGKQCGRYEIGELLGEGGMGEVYRATDPVLRRDVAVKFLHCEDPRLIARFLQEARMQARLDHEHICKIYEAGELDGKPYIVMQLINGQTLAHAQNEMTLEQKVRVAKEVADAVQSAHRIGLIHRDIKPTNIMVEKMDDGQWRPCVMDFGLARDVTGPGATTTAGQAIGTPSYMSPEQARGSKDIDRRTDVYGLGATLYHILTRRPPFDGGTGIEIMVKLVQEDPISPRKIEPSIPVDLETIVMKCIEKEPGRRYDSAHFLAEELQRFLDGEPIVARRASWSYRAAKKLRKHKAIVFVSGFALLAVMILAVLGLHARWTAARQARLAQEFGQEIERIDTIMRIAYLTPLHDTRPEKLFVRQTTQRIEEQMRNIGRAAEAPGNFALGRGQMALGEYDAARSYLEKAWNSGLQGPDVASALGLTLGVLYKARLDTAETIQDEQQRESERTKIDAEYRQPAVSYLKAGQRVPGQAPEYVEGLIAFYNRQYDESLKKAKAAFEKTPSLYEAKILEGDTHYRIANEKKNRGDSEAAMSEYRSADDSYRQAVRIGESDARGYERICSLWTSVMEVDLYGKGSDLRTHLDLALKAIDAALIADPERWDVHIARSAAYWRYGEYQLGHGEDPTEALSKAAESAKEAGRLQPNIGEASLYTAVSQHLQAEYDSINGRDPRQAFEAAIGSYKKLIQVDPTNIAAYSNLGSIYNSYSIYQDAHGANPATTIEEGIRFLKKAVQIQPQMAMAITNLGNAYLKKGECEKNHGQDSSSSFREAIAQFEKAVSINQNSILALNSLGSTYVAQAEVALSQGRDPRDDLKKSQDILRKAVSINPNNALPYWNLGEAYLRLGEYDYLTGVSPETSLSLSSNNFQKAIRIDPGDATTYDEMAGVAMIRARVELNAGRSPFAALDEAKAYLRKSLAIDPTSSDALHHLGDADLLEARWRIQRGNNPVESFARAQKALNSALELNPAKAEICLSLAELRRWQAEWRINKSQPLQTDLRDGLAMLGKALSINPLMADAVALHGALYLTQARSELDPSRRIESARRALESLERAFKMNPLLEREYRDVRREAQKFAKVA